MRLSRLAKGAVRAHLKETPAMTALPYEAPAPSDDAMWSAVLGHDATADGTFLYGVMTTGVYCRPSCPSRRPLRTNVRFFAEAASAQAAGLRACKRCHPDQASIAERHAEAVSRACALIDASEELPSLDALADAAGLSRFHFHRVFKALTGVTPKAYGEAQPLCTL